MLKIGDKVYFENRGSCTVTSILKNEFLTDEETKVVLRPDTPRFDLERLVVPLVSCQKSTTNTAKVLMLLLALLVPFSGCAPHRPEPKNYVLDDLYIVAKKAFDQQDMDAAIENFSAFVEKYPNSVMREVALYYLAESYRLSDQYAQAIEVYQQVADEFKTGFWADSARKDIEMLKQRM